MSKTLVERWDRLLRSAYTGIREIIEQSEEVEAYNLHFTSDERLSLSEAANLLSTRLPVILIKVDFGTQPSLMLKNRSGLVKCWKNESGWFVVCDSSEEDWVAENDSHFQALSVDDTLKELSLRVRKVFGINMPRDDRKHVKEVLEHIESAFHTTRHLKDLNNLRAKEENERRPQS